MTDPFNRTKLSRLRDKFKAGSAPTCPEGTYLADLLAHGDLIHGDEAEDRVVKSLMLGLTVEDQHRIQALADSTGVGLAGTVLTLADEALRARARFLRQEEAA